MRERDHLPDTAPYPQYEAPMWAIHLAVWCRRHRYALGQMLVTFLAALCLGLAGFWLLGVVW